MNLSKKAFAELIGKSPRHVSNLIDEGMPASGGGRGKALEIEASAAIEWLIEREIGRRCGFDDDADGDEDVLLKRARRHEIELKIEERKRLLAPVQGVDEIMLRIAGIFAAQLDGLSSRVAGELAAMDDPAEIRSYVHAETRQIRAATSEQLLVEVQALAKALDQLDAGDDGGDDHGAADEDAE